ncbi:hypothetical protein RR46_03069 [Papilio xuthus]|uniref:Ommochrome-binding protein n=1 Tax=Papilio xuthus TaxID=66420 RepID=A0A194Q6N7_PAPXU|nr:hypothetical protein RR46_03069 [Papilio xuthus]
MVNLKLLIFVIIGVVAAIPIEDTLIHKDYFQDCLIVYQSEHDIVNILVPTNSINFDDKDEMNNIDDYQKKLVIFFVEADIKNGERIDKGLFVLKNGNVSKLLDNGRDAAASADDSQNVFFGTENGIYIYNNLRIKAEAYGNVTDNVISIVKENGTDAIYYLNKDNELFKVTDKGNKVIKINEVVDAQEMVLDMKNNLYYITKDKDIFVYNNSSIKKIEGFPEKAEYFKLIKPPTMIKDSALVLCDNQFYWIYSNGTCEKTRFQIETDARPTAYAMEAGIFQFYSYNKKIYRYNIIEQQKEPLKELGYWNGEEPSKEVYRCLFPKFKTLRKLEYYLVDGYDNRATVLN